MSNQLIQKEYIKKVKLINYYNKKYYNDNVSEISDSEYDLLKKEIIDLEKRNKFLKSKYSPAKIIGHKPSKNFKKVSHKVPMLSLANAFSETDLKNFEVVNKIYSDFFNTENPPARACVEGSCLPKDVLVEIDCIAFLD